MDDRFGIKLLAAVPAAHSEVAGQIAELLDVDVVEVERALASSPDVPAMTAPSREGAERMQDAFAAVGIASRIVALESGSVGQGTRRIATEGRYTVAPGEKAEIPEPLHERGEAAPDSSSGSGVGAVGRWIAQVDRARTTEPSPQSGGLTITIPPMNREQRIVVVAAGVTVLGLFAPVIRGPLGVTFSFVDGSSFTALVLFAACVLVAGLVATRRTALAVIPLAALASTLGYRFVRLSWEMIRLEGEIQSMQQEDVFGLSSALFGSVGMAWGWVPLLLGVGVMIYGVASLLRQ